MKRARTTLITIFARDAITSFGDLAVEPSPDGHGEREVEDGSDWPEEWQTPGKVSQCVGATETSSIGSDNPHLLHEHFVGEVWIIDRHARVVQGDEAEAILSVEPSEVVGLSAAEVALAIEQDNIRRG